MEQQDLLKKPESNKPVTPTVTDAQLDSASLEVNPDAAAIPQDTPPVEPPKVEGKVAEPPPVEEPVDQAERSRLGRRVKGLEDDVRTLLTKIDGYFSNRSEPSRPRQEEELPEVIQTPDDVRRVMRAEKEREKQFLTHYRSDYAKRILDLGNDDTTDKDLHDDIVNEMMVPGSPFNEILSENAIADAEINYARAMKSVISKKYARPKQPAVPGRSETPVAPTGVTVGTRTTPTLGPQVQLDEASMDFVKRLGLKEEFVKKALSREAPIGIKK